MRVLLILSHSIEEHDQLKLLTGLGYEVFSLGGYIDPTAPHDPKRPAIDAPVYPELIAAVDALGTDDNIGNAAHRIPAAILEWLGADGVIICHHYLERIYGQWDYLAEWRAAGGRVVWRTVGQSVEGNERAAKPYRDDGLEIVRYSPRESAIPGYAGADAVIRFYKDPEDWFGWTGNAQVVTNVTQHLVQRDPWCNPSWYLNATDGLPCRPAGPGSELLPGGLGEIAYGAMKQLLRDSRAYVYTGTQPASYTLGFLEALMTGTPIVSIGPAWMRMHEYGPQLFEGHTISFLAYNDYVSARHALGQLLSDSTAAGQISERQRNYAISEFGVDAVGAAWAAFLG